MTRPHGSRGVSILEVVIVSGIIGMLALLTLPTYRTILFKVYRTRMQTQLAMIMNDESLYHRDEGSFYPPTFPLGSLQYGSILFRPEEVMPLPGQDQTMPAASRHYAFLIYRLEPTFSEPLIYAYASGEYGNDLDGDSFPDIWIKVGNSPPQLYMDDLTNTIHTVELN